jgi:DNA-binding MurR/RpiR family transcriptional regulator
MSSGKRQKSDQANPSERRLTPLEARVASAQLPASRRELMERTLGLSSETVFMSARQLARRLDVDPATIVRTVQALGYGSFAEFAEGLRQHFLTHITPYSVLRASVSEKKSVSDHVRDSFASDASNLETVRASIDAAHAEEAAKQLCQARRVLIAGADLNYALAFWLQWSLNFVGINAEAPEASTLTKYKARLLTREDVFIAISFRRCLKATVEALNIANEQGAKSIGLTDSRINPIGQRARLVLSGSIESPNVAGSIVAPAALLGALVVAISHVRERHTLDLIQHSHEEYSSGDRWWKDSES